MSPRTAPRQCPTCKGPVGLADTNSILYFFFLFLFDPYLEPNLITLNKYFSQNEILNEIFKKPGSTISMSLNSLKLSNSYFFMISPIFNGVV